MKKTLILLTLVTLLVGLTACSLPPNSKEAKINKIAKEINHFDQVRRDPESTPEEKMEAEDMLGKLHQELNNINNASGKTDPIQQQMEQHEKAIEDAGVYEDPYNQSSERE